MAVPLLLSGSLDLKFFFFGVPDILVPGRKRRKLDLVGIQHLGLQVGKILGPLLRGSIQPVLSVKSLFKSDSLLRRKERFDRRNHQSRMRIKAASLRAY